MGEMDRYHYMFVFIVVLGMLCKKTFGLT